MVADGLRAIGLIKDRNVIVNRMLVLMALMGLAGCAGTQQTAVTPEAPAAAATAAAATPAPEPVSVENSAAPQIDALPSIVAQPGISGPHQCMLVWAQGMQDAMKPWVQQVCDACTVAP